VHHKLKAFNCLKVLKIPAFGVLCLQEDQDCSIPTSFDLETRRTGQRNAIPKAPSDPQESPKFQLVILLFPKKLSLDKLKDKALYIAFLLQASNGSGPGMPNYRKSIRTIEEGDPQQWMDVITRLREIWTQNTIKGLCFCTTANRYPSQLFVPMYILCAVC
jgi:hypothetical protein